MRRNARCIEYVDWIIRYFAMRIVSLEGLFISDFS